MGVPPELSSSMGGFLILLLSAASLLVLAAQAQQQQGLQSADLGDAGGSLLKLDLNKLRTRRDANPGQSDAKKKSEREKNLKPSKRTEKERGTRTRKTKKVERKKNPRKEKESRSRRPAPQTRLTTLVWKLHSRAWCSRIIRFRLT